MSISCPTTQESLVQGSNIIAQQLFLGASINGFSTNLQWGGSPSQLNITLINDFGSAGGPCNLINSPGLNIFNIKHPEKYDTDNHYYDCDGDSCYVDENGNDYDPNRPEPKNSTDPPPSRERRIPGKVFHYMANNGDLVSKYWRTHDPGFFGAGSIMNPQGDLNLRRINQNKILPYRYNLINIPAMFRFGYFTFGGIITGWEATVNGLPVRDADTHAINVLNTPLTYRVTMQSPDLLLSQCKVILDGYAGSIFCSLANTNGPLRDNILGGPTNYTGGAGKFFGLLKQGNIANVFNVYGFLESYGFGASLKNNNGIPLADVLEALCTLTSATVSLGDKYAFSPFGRIICPSLLTDAIDTRDEYYGKPTYANFKNYSFGLFTPENDARGVPRISFALDLSEIPRPPRDVRLEVSDAGVLSISDIIGEACRVTGKDWHTIMIRKNGINFIKVKTIDRTVVTPPNIIENTVKDLTNQNIPVTQSGFGQNHNNANPRVLFIGGNQQRLYQAKSFLLGYSNSHLVYHPVLEKFVDYYRFGKTTKDKSEGKKQETLTISKAQKFVDTVRLPLAYSTRNIQLCNLVNGPIITEIWSNEQKLNDYVNTNDAGFSDVPVGGNLEPMTGNYSPAAVYTMPANPTKTGKNDSSNVNDENPRYIPLFLYSISPFFGYSNDIKIPKSSGVYTTRFIRPVYFDTITGQIVVLFRGDELPVLSLGSLPPIFANRPSEYINQFGTWNNVNVPQGMQGNNQPNNGSIPAPPIQTPSTTKGDPFDTPLFTGFFFSITESEFRAAMSQDGLDGYLMYCMSKLDITKPDLFVMLIRAYQLAGKAIWRSPGMGTGQVGGQNGMSGDPQKANQATPILGLPGGKIQWSFQDVLNVNFNLVLNYEFLNDLKTIVEFIKNIGQTYYGKQYAVSLPTLLAYKDSQYADIQIPAGSDTVGVYHGSGKIYHNYDVVDSAWEEFGNFIDDNIVIGGPASYTFADDNGKISAIVGYNATPIKDYASEKWCNLNEDQRNQVIRAAIPDKVRDSMPGVYDKKECAYIKSNFELSTLMRYFSCDKLICPSLSEASLGTSEYILLGLADSGREDAYGKRLIGNKKDPCGIQSETVTIPTQKLYIKTKCETEIAFLDPFNLRNPKAIINSPGVDLAFSSLSYKEDPNCSVLSNVAAEDFAFIEWLKTRKNAKEKEKIYEAMATTIKRFNYQDTFLQAPLTADQTATFTPDRAIVTEMINCGVLKPGESWSAFVAKLNSAKPVIKGKASLDFISFVLRKVIVPITSTNYLLPAVDTGHDSKTHYQMAPKKANPIFAAIPLQDNVSCYGPWTNYPDLVDKNKIFPGMISTDNLTEQLISNTVVEKKSDWVPWNYGGMAFLDREILYAIENATSYQTRLESGGLSIAGSPIFSLAGNLRIRATDIDIHDKIIKTYKNIPYNALQLNNYHASDYVGLLISGLGIDVNGGTITSRYEFSSYSSRRGIFNKENSDRNRMIATERISLLKKVQNIQLDITNSIRTQMTKLMRDRGGSGKDLAPLKSKLFGTSPTTMLIGKVRSYIPLGAYSIPDSNAQPISSPEARDDYFKLGRRKQRFDSDIGQYQTREAVNQLTTAYGSQAGMSLDGLYSPVSFYPTHQFGTYPISSRYVTQNDKNRKIICPGCNNEYTITINEQKHPCPLCQKSKVLPVDTASSNQTTNTTSDTVEPPEINFITLNPIIVPTGEFRNINAQPKGSGERSRHNISFIARQDYPIRDRDILIKHNLTDYKDNDEEPHPDWTDIDLSYQEDYGAPILLNNRFFAHRGPMMLHGWGYDKDGYPVPNAADEPVEIDAQGRPKRFFLTSSGTNDLTSDGAFLPTGDKQLGDIIGKGWTKEGGEWTRKPSDKFYLNWAERSDLWPIGPIDLRWDYDKKIWVGGGGDGGCANAEPPYIIASGNNNNILSKFISTSSKNKKKCSYKMVYGVLEQDLVKLDNHIESSPTRAFLDDLEYGLKPLPENIRRLIYIVDRTGYTAPRGAKLLLRYNSDTGFYEPVSKQQYIVFGLINGNNTASVEFTYMPGYKSGDYTYKGTINYVNVLNLKQSSSDSRGVFMYDNSRWNLIAIG